MTEAPWRPADGSPARRAATGCVTAETAGQGGGPATRSVVLGGRLRDGEPPERPAGGTAID